jgi:hypothetical protein
MNDRVDRARAVSEIADRHTPSREALHVAAAVLERLGVALSEDHLTGVAEVLDWEAGLPKTVKALNDALSIIRPAQPTMSLELEDAGFVTLRVDRRLTRAEADKVLSALAGTVAAMTTEEKQPEES